MSLFSGLFKSRDKPQDRTSGNNYAFFFGGTTSGLSLIHIYIVWENVPGAFSSNKGEDFKAVLEAVIGIVEPNAQVPLSLIHI